MIAPTLDRGLNRFQREGALGLRDSKSRQRLKVSTHREEKNVRTEGREVRYVVRMVIGGIDITTQRPLPGALGGHDCVSHVVALHDTN